MRRILFASALALVAACGSKKPTMTATPAIKADVTDATSSMQASHANVDASLGVNTFASEVALSALSGSAGTLDIAAGLPDPDTLHPVRPDGRPGILSLRDGVRSKGVTSGTASGCIKSDGNHNAVYVAAGTAGCTATDHLEITYENGDKVNIKWSGTEGQSFTLTFAVVTGKWAGTNLSFSVSGSATGGAAGAFNIHEGGTLKFAGLLKQIDSDFNLDYTGSVSLSGQSASITLTYKGSALDRVAKSKYEGTTSLTFSGNDTAGSASVRAGVALSKLDATLKPIHTIALEDVSISASGSSTTSSFTVAGDVTWDGAVVGTLKVKNQSDVVIAWTDGTETAFDWSMFSGGIGN